MALSDAERLEAMQMVAEADRRAKYKIRRYFPDCTKACRDPQSPNKKDHAGYCRVLYPKQLVFFRASVTHPEVLFLSGNRVGKTDAAAYEIACHLTGVYPHWWDGIRFTEAGDWWAAGKDAKTTRDIVQQALWGPPREPKTGMLPAHLIADYSPKPGVPDAIETIWVTHATGKLASIQLKSHDQGADTFVGTSKQGVWIDEECPHDVYVECLLRTMTTGGIVICTLTPLMGLTEFIQNWLEQGEMVLPDGQVTNAYAQVFGKELAPASGETPPG